MKMHQLRKLRRRRGQALVEFALVLPLFVATFFSVFEVALIWGANALCHQATERATHSLAVLSLTATSEQHIVTSIINQVNAYVVARPVRIEIYSTGSGGGNPSASSEDTYDGSGNLQSSTFSVNSRISSMANPQFLAVRVTYQYTWLTSFLSASGAALTLQATSTAMIVPEGG